MVNLGATELCLQVKGSVETQCRENVEEKKAVKVFLSVSLLFNRVTSDVSRRVPPTLRSRHLVLQYFDRHLQYL